MLVGEDRYLSEMELYGQALGGARALRVTHGGTENLRVEAWRGFPLVRCPAPLQSGCDDTCGEKVASYA